MKYTIEISDQDGKACRISLAFPLIKSQARPNNSTWQTLDQGLIKFHSGGCGLFGIKGSHLFETDGGAGFFGSAFLTLFVGKKPMIQLDEFEKWNGLNRAGEGKIAQAAVLSFKPGNITWVLLE